MRVELSRFRVKPGHSHQVDEWLAALNSRIGEVQQTLDRERMKCEVIFREIIGQDEYLYWFSVQADGGEPVDTSPFEVDALHAAFFDECLDHEHYGQRDAQPQVVMIPKSIADAMQWNVPHESVEPFQRMELVRTRKVQA